MPDLESSRAVAERSGTVLRPPGAFGRLDELAIWLAGWQRTATPAVNRAMLLIFAGDHGVAAEEVSAYPASVTAAMVEALHAGAATAAVMARHLGIPVAVVDVGVGEPTGNIRIEPAMSVEQFQRAVASGTAAVSSLDEPDLVVLGEIGIGNTTSAAAVAMAVLGGDVGDWVGPGTGLDEAGVTRKMGVVADAVERIGAVRPLEALRQLGGWELAAIAGAVTEARQKSIPVLLDGFVVTSSVMPLEVTRPGYLDHCWPAHVSAEPGHRRLVAELGKAPILDLGLRLGEGTGGLAALPIVDLAARSVVEVATFEEWGPM